MPTLRYVGPIDEVYVVLLRRAIERDEEFDAKDEHAEQLLVQTDNFVPADAAAEQMLADLFPEDDEESDGDPAGGEQDEQSDNPAGDPGDQEE